MTIGTLAPMGFRRFANLFVLAAGFGYVTLLWWAADAIDLRDVAWQRPATIVAEAPAGASHWPSANAAGGPVIRLSTDYLQFAALLMLSFVGGVGVIVRWARGRAQGPSVDDARASASSGQGADAQKDRLRPAIEQLTRQLLEHGQQLTATQAAVSEFATDDRKSAAPYSANSPLSSEDLKRQRETEPARSLFLSYLSHELRTPLHGILGHTQNLLRDSETHPTHYPGLQAIERSGRQLLTVLNDLIDLARLESGELALVRHPLDLRRLFEEARTTLQANAASRDLELVFETNLQPPTWVVSDGRRLRRLLIRLTESAIASSPAATGTPTVLRLALRLSKSDLTIALTGLRDTDATVQKETTPPSDLGYLVGQRLVSAFGGETLRDVACGAFSARIPCETIEPPAVLPPDLQLQLPKGRYCRMLIVEPTTAASEVCSHVLDSSQCVVEAESDIEQARLRLQQDAFDVVLLDTGLASPCIQADVSELRLVATGEPKVVALGSGNADQTEPGPDREGFDAVLAKPVDPTQLLAVVGTLLELPAPNCHGVSLPTRGHRANPWPQPLGRDIAARIDAALKRGDIDDLFALTTQLADHPDAPKPDVEALRLAAHLFDFEALRRLADYLTQGPVERQLDA